MDILNSSWFVSMLKKSGSSPQARLLSLFDILGDWLQAPNMRELVTRQQHVTHQPSNELLDYLTLQARACGVQMPELLAQQLYFMARGALQEALESDTATTIAHAREAASALIRAQSEREPQPRKPAYAIAASLLIISGLCGGLLLHFWQGGPTQTLAQSLDQASMISARAEPQNPANTAEIYAVMEQMRKGVCQFPEALQLPGPQQKVYVELVVDGLIPTTAEDQAIARALIQKVRCNYTPMLMSNSVS